MGGIPSTIGRFQIQSLLGRGGMGEVYKAWDPVLERFTAVKVIHATLNVQDQIAERFLREAKAASKLRHPNIVTVYDLGEFEGQLFLAMEYIPGEDLQRVIDRKQALSYQTKLNIIKQLVEGVASAHNSGIIHRDLKPSNILVDQDYHIKIVDFGLARIGTSDLTGTGRIMGTPNYMSPEQVQGLVVDERSDIFALGAIFYELITGDKAFPGHDPVPVLYKIISENPPPVLQFFTAEAHDLDHIIRRCLEKDRNKRLANCAELLHLIGEVSTSSFVNAPTMELNVPRRESKVAPNNLPLQKNELIGREQDLLAVQNLLQQPDVVLVTLSGPGGSGKTQLALQTARELLTCFSDGVYFVSLESVYDPHLVISSIAQSLNVTESGGRTLIESLIKHFRENVETGMLLVLDNFEQVLDAATDVHRLISGHTLVKFLITSRERLNLSDEQEYVVRPLMVSAPDGTLNAETISQIPSVRLFTERAQLTRPDFVIRPENASIIREICKKLDGLPLAIELVAARMKVLSPDEILRKLETSMQVVGSGPKDLPERLRSLQGAISWSYQLLTSTARQMFLRLSVFRGNFPLEAAEAICADSEEDALEQLLSLVEKSLMLTEQRNDQSHFKMLNVLQEFAFSRLKQEPEYATIRQKHASYFEKTAEALVSSLSTTSSEFALHQFDLYHDNFLFGLQWYNETENWEKASQLALALWKFWETQSFRREGRDRLSNLLRRGGEKISVRTQTRLVYAAGVLSEALGEYSSARAFFERNLEINRSLNDRPGIANSLNNVAVLAERQGDVATAQTLYREARDRWKELGNQTAVALCYMHLGSIAANNQAHAQAWEMYEQSLSVWKTLNDLRGKALLLNLMGDLASRQQDFERAFPFYQEALSCFEQIADQRGIALTLENLALLLSEDEDFDQARGLLVEALKIHETLSDQRGMARALECTAVLKMHQKDFDAVARIGGASTALRDATGAARNPEEKLRFERTMEEARKETGHLNFAQQWLQGMSLSLQDIIREAQEGFSE